MKNRIFLLLVLFNVSCGVRGRPLPPDNPYFVDKSEFKPAQEKKIVQEIDKQTEKNNETEKKKTQKK